MRKFLAIAQPFRRRPLFFWLTGLVTAVLIVLLSLRSEFAIAHLSPTPSLSTPISPVHLLRRGQTAYDNEQFAEAIDHWQTARNHPSIQANFHQYALVLTNLALAYQRLGQWETAQHALSQARTLLQDPDLVAAEPNQESNYWQIYGRLLNVQGLIHWHQGNPDAALDSWQQALNAYDRVPYILGQIGSQINRARALQALGFFSRSRLLVADIQTLLDTQPDSSLKAVALRNVGNMFWQMGQLDNAIVALTDSLAIENQSAATRSNTLLALGNVEWAYRDQAEAIGHDQEAHAHQTSALQWYEQAASISASPILQLRADVNRLSLLVAATNWDDAIALVQPIAATLTALPPHPATLSVDLNYTQALAQLALAQRPNPPPFPTIARRFAHIAHQAHQLGYPRLESYALGKLGHLYEQQQQWSEARSLTEQALDLATTSQSSEIQYQWQWQLGRILMNQAKPQPALNQPALNQPALNQQAIAAYQQAEVLLKQMRRDLLVTTNDVQFSFRDQVEPLYRQYVDLLLRSPHPSPASLETAAGLIDALQLAALDNILRCDVQRFAHAKTPVALSQTLIDAHTAILYPIVLADRLEVILVVPGQPLQHRTIPVSRNEIDTVTADLQGWLPKPSRRRQSQQAARQLYDWLIRPWEDELKIHEPIESSDLNTLVFVLDGGLKQLPMAALWDGERYLLERYAIAVAPSLKLVSPAPLDRPIRVLAAGSTEALDHPLRDGQFPPLPNVENELESISTVFPTETLLNNDFTQANLAARLRDDAFEILHLATHGEFSSDPNRTFVVLDDVPLYTEDLENLLRLNTHIQSPIKMIVLSACQTAAGDSRATLGLAGLTLRAGARSALATLWSVEDLSAATLMQEFYRQLANHPDISRAEALRRSQLHLWHQDDTHGKDWQAPYFWSPYVLVGNWL